MRKVFLDKLPHSGKNINWKKSIGCEVLFIYDDIKGELEILDYKKNNVLIQYKSNKQWIYTGNFIKCKIGNILGLINHNYKHQIGDIITDINSGKLQILEQVRIRYGSYGQKGYKYKCLICGNIDYISETHLFDKRGCSICSGKKILQGYNDMWTTNPNLAKLLADPNDGYKYMQNSNKKIDWRCPNCGNIIKNKKISMVNDNGLSCPKCGDGISYPEKFMFNILRQLHIGFIYQLSKSNKGWCDSYRYDFYFKINNKKYIIEVQGLQHFKESFKKIKSDRHIRELKEEQENDRLKKKLAMQNGIKEENYIAIDCRKSELDWIKNNVLESRLNDIFDLSNIDWLQCHKFACGSLIKQACRLWNKGIYSTTQIGKILKLVRTTIRKYLKQGAKLGWCNYDPKEVIRKNGENLSKSNNKRRKVICLNNNKVFGSIIKASKFCNLKSHTSISACCRGKVKSAGKDPVTKETLKWMYYDEYLKVNEINKEDDINNGK